MSSKSNYLLIRLFRTVGPTCNCLDTENKIKTSFEIRNIMKTIFLQYLNYIIRELFRTKQKKARSVFLQSLNAMQLWTYAGS